MAWFPEVGRLSPRFGRYAKIGYKVSRAKFDATFEHIRQQCACSTCANSVSVPSEICKATLVEVIVGLGLYIARMIVSPGLYPKRSGILTFYARHHIARVARSSEVASTPSDVFMRSIATRLPSPEEMLKAGALLFANSGSAEIDAQENLMRLTSNGFTIFLTSGFKDSYNNRARNQQSKTTIMISPGWMCLFGARGAV